MPRKKKTIKEPGKISNNRNYVEEIDILAKNYSIKVIELLKSNKMVLPIYKIECLMSEFMSEANGILLHMLNHYISTNEQNNDTEKDDL